VRAQGPAVDLPAVTLTPEVVSETTPQTGPIQIGQDQADVHFELRIPGISRLRISYHRIARFFGWRQGS
jgi:hypothetical protein